MKIVNSPVARPDLDRINWGSIKSPELAKSKHIARKKERAMLKQQDGRNLFKDLSMIEEDVQQLRLERELAYRNLMRRIMANKKHDRRSERSIANTRLAFRIIDINGNEPKILASCALH